MKFVFLGFSYVWHRMNWKHFSNNAKSPSELDNVFCKSVVLDWVRSWCRLEGPISADSQLMAVPRWACGSSLERAPSWFASWCSRNHFWSSWQSIRALAFRICGFWLWAELKRLLNVLFCKAPQTEHFIFSVLYLWTFLFVPKFACFSLGKNTNRSVLSEFLLNWHYRIYQTRESFSNFVFLFSFLCICPDVYTKLKGIEKNNSSI